MILEELDGKIVNVSLSREGLHGSHYGLVRRVVTTGRKQKVLSTLTFQLRDVDRRDAATQSARFRGARVVLRGRELETLRVRLRSGRFVTLKEWRQR